MPEPCPICKTKLEEPKVRYASVPDSQYFECPICGNFEISYATLSILDGFFNEDKRAQTKLNHAIRQMQKNSRPPFLDREVVKRILEKPLPKPKEQADLLIRWIAENIQGPGEFVTFDPKKHGAIIGAGSSNGSFFIVDYLIKSGLLIEHEQSDLPNKAIVTLTFKGWDHYENLKLGGAIYRKAFMAMKFGDPILDRVVADIFKPNVEKAGFELRKLEDRPRAGLIDDRLRVEIQSSDFLVADLTHDNHGAYWEAGYAEGLGKPVIYTCEKSKWETVKTHFDTNHHLTIVWDKDNPEKAGEALKATIRATLPQLAKMED